MRKFTVESDSGAREPRVLEGTADAVRSNFATTGYFVELRKDRDDYIYQWNHAGGKGKVRIPAHILFDLPELLTVLNIMNNHSIMESSRIYQQQPVAILFPSGEEYNG